MLENLLKLENIQVLDKREQLLIIKGGGSCQGSGQVDQGYANCHTND